MPTLRKSFGRLIASKTKDLGHGVVEVIVSTSNKDRHGEIVSIKGLDTKQYSGVVLLNHDYEQLPIGKSIKLTKTTDGKLISRTQFAVDEFPLANTIYNLVKGGYMTDVSIGFIPKEFDPETNTWTKSEMIEYSHVAIGANPEAKVIKALGDMGITKDDFTEQVKQHMVKMKELIEPDEADPAEEQTPPESDDEAVTKGAVANVLLEGDKYERMEDFWEVIYAFCDAYYSQDAAVVDFAILLNECIDILRTVADGSYSLGDEDEEDDNPTYDSVVGLALKKGVTPLRKAELTAALAKRLDSNDGNADNELEQIATLKRLITLAEAELKQLPTEKDELPQKELRRKRIVVLGKTKQQFNSIDRIAESGILKLKQLMSEEM